jgi:hypothetical protein
MPNEYSERYRTAQYSRGKGKSAEHNLDNTVEEYLGRLEDKYDRIEKNLEFDAGHQKKISETGASFRKQTNLPAYNQPDPTGRN